MDLRGVVDFLFVLLFFPRDDRSEDFQAFYVSEQKPEVNILYYHHWELS